MKTASFTSSISNSDLRRHLSCAWILNLILYFFLMLVESINAFQSLLCQTLGFVEAHFLEVNHFTVHYEFQSKVMVSYF
jgi:hypothetical protein